MATLRELSEKLRTEVDKLRGNYGERETNSRMLAEAFQDWRNSSQDENAQEALEESLEQYRTKRDELEDEKNRIKQEIERIIRDIDTLLQEQHDRDMEDVDKFLGKSQKK